LFFSNPPGSRQVGILHWIVTASLHIHSR